VFGSGTHGLQSLTRSPPPRVVTSEELPVRAASVTERARGLGVGKDLPSAGG